MATPRRSVLRAALAALAGAPLAALGQRDGRPFKVALLLPADHPIEASFLRGLNDLGYVEGRNVVIERRSADGDFARLPALAADTVRGRPDLIVAFVTQASIAAKKATSTIPIVMVAVGNPVASGLVASLARPGGNVTGTGGQVAEVVGKQLELIRELRPGAKRIATLWNPANAVYQALMLEQAQGAAGRLGVRLDLVEARTPADLERRIPAIAADRPDAVLVFADPMFIAQARRIVEMLFEHRLLAIGGSRVYADAGMLATYAPDLAESARRAAAYADRILRGARPAELPVEFVDKFELVINLRAATALGVTVPPAMRARADQLIP